MCVSRVNCVITNVVTYMNYSCNYMQVFSKYKYNVKNTISPWYQIINFNVSTYKVGPCFFFFLTFFFFFGI